ncbi:unnamed protein product, partial [Candidula unifasciata]
LRHEKNKVAKTDAAVPHVWQMLDCHALDDIPQTKPPQQKINKTVSLVTS